MAILSQSVRDSWREGPAVSRSRIARLREIARSGEDEVIDGISVPPEIARSVLAVYDELTPHEQEVFAACCTDDFCSCVYRCAAAQAALPLAQLLVCLLQGADPAQTGTS